MKTTRRWATVLAGAACAAGLALASTSDANANANANAHATANAGTATVSPLTATGYIEIMNTHSHLCAGVSGSKSTGRLVVLEGCTHNSDREWVGRHLNPYNGQWYSVVNKYSGLCLGVDGNAGKAAAPLAQYHCADNPNQYWISVQTSTGFAIVNQMSGMCMSVDAARTAPGSKVTQYPCGNFVDQNWVSR